MKQKGISIMVVAAFLLGISLISTPAHAQITLKYANFPPAPTFPCVQMERWKVEVEKRTGGKVAVQTFPGSTLLNPKNMFEGVISGTADIGCLAKAASLALYDLIEKYNPKEFEQVKIITLFTCPPSNIMTIKPVKSLKDLKGLELRVGGTQADIIKNLGGIPVAMPQSDTPEALQKGTVKGHVSSMEVLKDFNYAAYTANATLTNLWVVTFAVVMNKDKWNSLPSDVKKVIDDLKREQAFWTGHYVDNHVLESLKWSKEKYNLQIFELPAGEKAEIPKLLKPLIDGYIARVTKAGLPGDQIIKDVLYYKEYYEKQIK